MPRLITLLTDFGTADGYVGEMKAVLASLAPTATIVDVAHDVAPHDVDGARLALARRSRGRQRARRDRDVERGAVSRRP